MAGQATLRGKIILLLEYNDDVLDKAPKPSAS